MGGRAPLLKKRGLLGVVKDERRINTAAPFYREYEMIVMYSACSSGSHAPIFLAFSCHQRPPSPFLVYSKPRFLSPVIPYTLARSNLLTAFPLRLHCVFANFCSF